jgi:hypothetical protein
MALKTKRKIKMKEDKVIDQIHKVREQIAKDCGFDAKKLVEHYLQRQKEKDGKVIYTPKEVS